MSVVQDAFARGAFGKWLEETPPGICEEGNLIVWRGYAIGEPFIFEWYRVAIKRWDYRAEIEVDCHNESMKDWMLRHKSYIKGKLIWYCRAVWQLIDDGLLDGCDFEKEEDDIDWGDTPVELSDEEAEWKAKEDSYDPFPY